LNANKCSLWQDGISMEDREHALEMATWSLNRVLDGIDGYDSLTE
jgi:hypothetical protein